MSAPDERDTIAAIATAPGRGAIGIVRASGPQALALAQRLTGRDPPAPRTAVLRTCLDHRGEAIDQGLLVCFPGPDSFTGEDVIEFQGHGGQLLLHLIWERLLALGARPARPGEFSERAFLNGRIDLTQAEAIADLIDAGSRQAARGAMRSLRGEFSSRVEALRTRLVGLRIELEAAIDFVDEDDVGPIGDRRLTASLADVAASLDALLMQAEQGRKLAQGAVMVIAGAPNVGKSSLLNRLAGDDMAIVTPIAGTTRDLLRTDVVIAGMPVRIVDTAGIRETEDPVEREGVARARQAIDQADLILAMDTGDEPTDGVTSVTLPPQIPVLRVRNKIDLRGEPAGWLSGSDVLGVSVLTGEGMDLLTDELAQRLAGAAQGESTFTARRRQVQALKQCADAVEAARAGLQQGLGIELLAEDLRRAHDRLGEITGRVTPDQLLGEIFSTFCIGK
ncbi:tRNA uridine-5-carboxymethylaminomethyl(34) synthesis GTPase MnmE [Acidihalobacter prosperus]|uniref:tRNA modification GTPase MnmE n=1 Tax=Acidihalobacter prosperus TaxID=160660 RepID=A0A1A6C4U1_9GAMM|nr:tRNA uridine-5-carboxymethylaminomethyl(34) synthesis GTPase MnmE [Acidihalobacter prosperus]OBS09569.1 tRNA modification GTPase [Acidihalobacter prosperus]